MFKGSKWYKMKDDGSVPGMIEIEPYTAKAHNEFKNGIFFSVNEFEGTRKIQNLKRLNAWYAETDGLQKEKVLERIESSPIRPSVLIESKNGYHMYWFIEGECDLLQYRQAQEMLADWFEGDRLKDVTRVMRVPGFNHWKNPNDPFLVKEMWRDDEAKVTFEELERAFSGAPRREKIKASSFAFRPLKLKRTKEIKAEWKQFVRNYNVMQGLRMLSGSDAVRGDVYGFDENPNGSLQIVVNGNRSSSWIDSKGKIGSHKRWGPNLYTWLMWYWRDESKVREIYDQYFKP